MNATRRLLAQQHYTPSIRFIGKHFPPNTKKLDHTPHVHPASPTEALPDSFVAYRSRAQQHGPLNHRSAGGASSAGNSAESGGLGHIGAHSGHDLGPIAAGRGQFFDRNELPERFRRTKLVWAEIEAVESGGASQHT